MPDRPSLDALREAAEATRECSCNDEGCTDCINWRVSRAYIAALEAEVERLTARAAKVRERCAQDVRPYSDEDCGRAFTNDEAVLLNTERAAILAILGDDDA